MIVARMDGRKAVKERKLAEVAGGAGKALTTFQRTQQRGGSEEFEGVSAGVK